MRCLPKPNNTVSDFIHSNIEYNRISTITSRSRCTLINHHPSNSFPAAHAPGYPQPARCLSWSVCWSCGYPGLVLNPELQLKLPISLHFQILSDCLIRRHLRSPTWSELGTHDHPSSAWLIFYPEGHTYGCRTLDFLNSNRRKSGTGRKGSSCCPNTCFLFLGRLKKARMCCPSDVLLTKTEKYRYCRFALQGGICAVQLGRSWVHTITLAPHGWSSTPKGIHTDAARRISWIQLGVNQDTGQKELLCCPPTCSLFLGRLKKPRMCCWIGWFHQTNKNRLY